MLKCIWNKVSMVVEMDDAEMAGDVAPFIEEAQNMVMKSKPYL